MVVVHIQPHLPAFTVIAREKDTVRLGERCPLTRNLTEEAMGRARATLERCLSLAKAHQAEAVVAVATSAVREAANGQAFLQEIERQLGLRIDLISGQEEARRIYLGVLSGMAFHGRPHIIIDIGGGSTELILGDGGEPAYLSSTKVGAVRLTAECVTSDPISATDYQRLRSYVQGMLEWPTEDLRARLTSGQTATLVGTSGTAETLAALHAQQNLGAVPLSLQGYGFSRTDLGNLVQTLRKLDDSQRRETLDLPPRRSEILLAGAVILHEAMTLLGMDWIVYCDRALREGIIVDWMLGHGLIADHLRYQSTIRQRSVLRLAEKYQVNLSHAQQVAQLAVSLFDQTQGRVHFWGQAERDLLWAAAILHNSGHHISHSAHHKHSYYLIRYGELLGYTENEIELVANIARYHRKNTPKKRHEAYGALVKTDRQRIEQLSALLRVAVALDRRQLGAIPALTCEALPERGELHLYLQAGRPGDDCALELWSLGYKKEAFEAVFGLKLVPHLRPAERPQQDAASLSSVC
ncbi:MAG: Ppx/GppA family phosphatase [Gloeomargaritaceae cyanobacterium C42_A2020_066]|nr:Ppx/GppA family phosphatase [Gloeomargaritaceae cyanobacterium C42_A2020_066]